MWEVEGACAGDEVSDTHLAQIELAIPGSAVLSSVRRGVRIPEDVQTIAPSAKPARVLSTLTFSCRVEGLSGQKDAAVPTLSGKIRSGGHDEEIVGVPKLTPSRRARA